MFMEANWHESPDKKQTINCLFCRVTKCHFRLVSSSICIIWVPKWLVEGFFSPSLHSVDAFAIGAFICSPASQNHTTMRNRNRNMLKYAVSLPTKFVILWCNYSNIIVDVVKLFFRSLKESAINHIESFRWCLCFSYKAKKCQFRSIRWQFPFRHRGFIVSW